MLGSADQVRRRRSTDEIRLPSWLPTGGEEARSADPGQATGGGSSEDGGAANSGVKGSSEGPQLQLPYRLRRANSADLLVLEDPDLEEGDNDEGFSSEDEPFRFRPPSIASTTTSQRSSKRGVNVEDWSDRQSQAFVKELRIPSYHAVGSEGSGFVVFDIEIETRPSNAATQGTLIRIHKRYSAFVRLRADLLSTFPRLRRIVPRLPPKSSLAKYRPSFLERRRQHLAYWLSTILLHPLLGGAPIVREWILE
ncbi:hypothetical protein JCM21900_003115 [Sporobolomyces salmonicolor]